MHVTTDSVSVVTAGLDHWFEFEDPSRDSSELDLSDFEIDEWRLKQHLGVSHFRQPPDYRPSRRFGGAREKNLEITVPTQRFPQWHFCAKGCGRLAWKPLPFSSPNPRCQHCAKGWLKQVPFVVICEAGHMADFPFLKWVHEGSAPGPDGHDLTLFSTGGGGLGGQVVRCSCSKSRSLSGITSAQGSPAGGQPGTLLSSTLSPDSDFLCAGWMPWHGASTGDGGPPSPEPWVPAGGCGQQVRAALRASTNTYFAEVRSSIFLPRTAQEVPANLIRVLEAPHLSQYITAMSDAGQPVLDGLKRIAGLELEPYTDDQIDKAVGIVTGAVDPDQPAQQGVDADTRETAFRRVEFGVLQQEQDEEELHVGSTPLAEYGDWVAKNFARIMVVSKLRETRAHVGFHRVKAGGGGDVEELKAMLRRNPPGPNDNWLPAYVVYGEGIFLELREDRLSEWESKPAVQARVGDFQRRYRGRPPLGIDPGQPIPPRFFLLHTIAHIVMNQFSFDAGYDTASIRERLYVSTAPEAPLGGVLIYTAAGDAEGTMGGLVRMGKPDRLGPSVKRAIDRARWCASDPLCMEYAEHGGQGPEGCNLAACHGCALVPETACEQFNRFLDRALIVGSPDSPELGFFT